jgi:hypothetical protein
MTRTAVPYSAPDLSALARLLERALLDHQTTHGRLPGHVEMMNLLARGAGKRNVQEFQADRASAARMARMAAIAPAEAPAATSEVGSDLWFDAPELLDPVTTPVAATKLELTERAAKTLKCFDYSGRLARWPLKLSQQRLALWILWMRFDARRVYTEDEVNRVLKAWHVYGDHATLRRELINHQLMTRKSDCSEYRKLVQWPDDEVQGLVRALRKRQAPYRLSNRPPRVLPAIAADASPQAGEQ